MHMVFTCRSWFDIQEPWLWSFFVNKTDRCRKSW